MKDRIENTVEFVKKTLAQAEGGHDWWHIHRVRQLALRIGKEEAADLFVVEMGALLHDIADSKFHDGDEEIGPARAREFLSGQQLIPAEIDHIEAIIRHISFKNSFDKSSFNSVELQVLQDADRLDAIGAIGIARAFSYGGHKGSSLDDPNIAPSTHLSKESYKKSDASTINHFYEKLFKLKDMMHTKTGKKLAQERHAFMELFVAQFYKEWDAMR